MYQEIVKIFAESILEGNQIYAELHKNGSLKDAFLNIPETLNYAKEFTENVYEFVSLN